MINKCISKVGPLRLLILLFAVLTTTLFVVGCYMDSIIISIWMKLMSIAYLILTILFLIIRGSFGKAVKVIEKKTIIREKKERVREYTGSDYRKIFHKRSCRFADSIKDENLEESDDINYFLKKKYKPCGLCNPGKK